MKIFCLLFSFAFCFTIAQTHRFIYQVSAKRDSTENVYAKTFFHLDINPEKALYYGRDFFISDSIKNLNKPTGFPAPKLNDIIVHTFNDNAFDCYEFIGWDLTKRKINPNQNWVLQPEKKKYESYLVQKATTTYEGRNWTAWFASEIPFQEGPHVFHGLPGLILELYDDKENFNFRLVKSENYKETNEVQLVNRFFKKNLFLDDSQYIKYKLTYYKDPFAYLKNGKVDWSQTEEILLDDGTKLTKENLRSSTEIQKRLIKKYNNPIELSKAIQYPK